MALGVLISLITLVTSAGAYHVFMDDRHYHTAEAVVLEQTVVDNAQAAREDMQLAQATAAVQMQVVAKESRLRDIERELHDIERRRASSTGAWAGDAERYQKLLTDRKILIERLEELK